MHRRKILACLATVSTLTTTTMVHAQASFPQKPITFVVPYLAGGTTDLVARVVSELVLEVGKNFPASNVKEFIDYIKSHPGLQYGTAGAGTIMNLAGVMFAQMAGLEMTHVAYKGSVPGITDTLGGHLPAMFDNLPASLPHIQAGKLKALAVAGSERSPSLPNVPTIAESGLKGYAIDPWFGVYGPAKLDPAITARLNAAVNEALSDPAVKDKLVQARFTPKGSTAQDFESLTQSEFKRLGEVAQKARIQVE